MKSILTQARVAKHQRDKVIRNNGGVAPAAGHEDYNAYCRFCKVYDKYY